MTPTDFDTLMVGRRFAGRTREALRLVLVDGLGVNDAAAQCGIRPPTVTKAIGALSTTLRCPTCNQPIARRLKP